jgi:hypothetical protein
MRGRAIKISRRISNKPLAGIGSCNCVSERILTAELSECGKVRKVGIDLKDAAIIGGATGNRSVEVTGGVRD